MSVLEIISETTNWSTVALAAVICLIIYVYVQWAQTPPGPRGLPYLGYYPFLSEDNFYLELLQMTKKYGKVFCFTVTGQLYAHVSDLRTIREVTVTKSDCFDQRPANFNLFQDLFGIDIFSLHVEQWKVLRKFFILKFKEFGMGKKAQEGVIQDCLKKIVSTLSKTNNKKLEALDLFSGLANDVVRHMIFGNAKFDENDIQQFIESYMAATESTSGKKILLAGPILKYVLIPFASDFRSYRNNKNKLNAIITKFMRQQVKEFDQNNIRNLVDAYLHEKKVLEEKKDTRAKYFTESILASSLKQFFGDGTVGVAWLTACVLTTLSLYPDIQKAIQSEIDDVVGRNRFPSLDDKSKLSYTSAAIYEGLRTTKFITLLPSVECTKETTVGRCRIPKGTVVVYNGWGALHDAEIYDDPDKFDPARFLSVDGKKPKCELPFVFGVGKRSCIGESLVTMQLLLYVATVLQHFDLHPVQPYENQTEEAGVFLKATPRTL